LDLRSAAHAAALHNARPESVSRKVWRKVRRRPAAAASLLLVLLALAAAGYLGQRGRHAGQVGDLGTAVAAALEAREWTPDQVAEVEARIDNLRRLAPDRAAAAEGRLTERLQEYGRGLIQSARLSRELTERIETVVTLLEPRAPAAGRRLREELQRRFHRWEREFELTAPFQKSNILNVARLRIDGETLWRQPAAAGAEEDPVVRTSCPCKGNVELWATFEHPSWETASRLGVVLHAGPAKGYAFLLSTIDLAGPRQRAAGTPTFAAVRQQGGSFRLQICRNGKVLRERRVPAAEIPPRPLHLAARREGDRLLFQVPGVKDLEFHDAFPLGGADAGVYGLWLPPGVGLHSAAGSRQALAVRASPVERADELFAGGAEHSYREALAWYRDQAGAPAGPELAQEARYKQALCHLALCQNADAADTLAALVREPGGRWPELARVQLLLLRLGRNQLDEADELLAALTTPILLPNLDLVEGLSPASRVERLAGLVPDEVVRRIWGSLYEMYSGLGLLRLNPRHADLMWRLVTLLDHLDFPARERILARFGVAFAYSLGGRPAEAVRTFEEVLQRDRAALYREGLRASLVAEYCWALRQAGNPHKALAVVNEHLCERPGVYRPECLTLLITRARVSAALGQWDGMEQDLDELLSRVPAGQLPYVHFAGAWMMRGFLREQRGDAAGARAAWRLGLFKRYPARAGKGPPPGPLGLDRINNAGYGLLIAALADELTDADVDELLNLLAPHALAGLSLGSYLRRDWLPTPVARGMSQSPEGHELLRKIAFLDLSPCEFLRGMVVLWAVETMRHGAFPAGANREQRELLVESATAGYEVYFTGGLSGGETVAQLLPLLSIWNPAFGRNVPLLPLANASFGRAAPARWEDVEPKLDPRLRGRLAYVFGHRALCLQRTELARTLFQRALANAAAGTALHRLAQAELDRLPAKK
jgi:tetratricopeptide (TPR) repeat protein